MKIRPTELAGIAIVEPTLFRDERGFFFESFNAQKFAEAIEAAGLKTPSEFVQDNHSCSARGVLRGLHFQREPFAQGKLVRVVKGSAYDVAVDIRPDSPTYGQSFGMVLDAIDHRMLWIPPGFAHGFQALEDDTHFFYKTTAYYNRESEGSIRWDDPTLAIEWPLNDPILADKDRAALDFWSFSQKR